MNYFFHPLAKEEFIEAINYYENCHPGLGLDFSKEIHSTIQRIIHFPHAGFEFSNNTRRSLTKRFPFGVIYQFSEEKNEIIILAIMQLNRNPNYWKHRTNE
jgi:plasmid stabilization system protein ParE